MNEKSKVGVTGNKTHHFSSFTLTRSARESESEFVINFQDEIGLQLENTDQRTWASIFIQIHHVSHELRTSTTVKMGTNNAVLLTV